MKRLVLCFGLLALVMTAGKVHAAEKSGHSAALQETEQVTEIVAKARRALGGDERLAGVTALTAAGSFRRVMGPREMEGSITLTLGRTDQVRHEEEISFPGGGGVTRLAGMNGDHVWEDTATRAGAPGRVIRMPGSGGGDREPDPEMVRRMQQRRLAALYQRMALALLLSGANLSYAGVAQTGDGTADVLETEDASGRPVRLFVSQESHLPIAISYREVRPIVMSGGLGGPRGMGPGGRAGQPTNPDATRRRTEGQEPPPPSTILMRLEDHRRVGGLLLPHLIVQIVDGEPAEEWTVKKYQVNPRLKSDVFDKK